MEEKKTEKRGCKATSYADKVCRPGMHMAFKKKLKKSVPAKKLPPKKREEKKLNNLRPWFFHKKRPFMPTKCADLGLTSSYNTEVSPKFRQNHYKSQNE